MKKYKAIIVDDESKIREVIRLKVEKQFSNIDIVGQAESIDEAYEKIQNLNPDFLFLDISMPGGTGFDLLNKYEEIPFEVIFVTGYGEFAIDALRASAADYVMKPVNNEELEAAIEKVIERLEFQNEFNSLQLLKQNIYKNTGDQYQIAIPDQDQYNIVRTDEIICCVGENKYTKIILSDGNTLLSSYNIGKFETILEPHGFFRTHKSFLININKIKSYKSDGTIVLEESISVPLSRRKKESFKNLILDM